MLSDVTSPCSSVTREIAGAGMSLSILCGSAVALPTGFRGKDLITITSTSKYNRYHTVDRAGVTSIFHPRVGGRLRLG